LTRDLFVLEVKLFLFLNDFGNKNNLTSKILKNKLNMEQQMDVRKEFEIVFSEFLKEYPGYVNQTLDEIRKTEFPSLNGVYADWTGAGLPANSLLEKHLRFLQRNTLGNPHSHHHPSTKTMEKIMQTRKAILSFLNASPEEYEVIFTTGATGAILILQHYMFAGGELLLTEDNHNSVNGLREIAKRKGATVRYAPITDKLQIDEEVLQKRLSYPRSWNGNKLFCYPAKSNYTGNIHSFEWVNKAQEAGWDVLLDTAAYLSNDRLDLSKVKPDFVPISFYKLFGYPTGIGCLVIKKEKYKKLDKSWFSGGSILLVSVMLDFFIEESIGYARFEDGTTNFSGIPAIYNGLEFLEGLGSYKERVTSIASWLHNALSEMRTESSSVVVHNSKGNDTVVFNIEKDGQIMDASVFEQAASRAGIYVRSGCFCNPGINEKLFGYSVKGYEEFYNSEIMPYQITLDHFKENSGKPVGALRASFGYVNNFRDVYKFAEFTKKYLASL